MPQRFRSLTIGGYSPLKPAAAQWADLKANPALRENALFARSLDEFPHAMEHSLGQLNSWGGARQSLRLTDLPLLLFAGTEDPNRSAEEMPAVASDARDATFFAVEGADHTGAADTVDVVAPQVIEFIDRAEANR